MLSRIILSAFLLISLSVSAQKKTATDIVVLKSGEKIYGTIIERNEGVSVKIETTKKNVVVAAWADIDKIKKLDEVETNWQKQLNLHKQLSKIQAKGFTGEFAFAGVSYYDASLFYSINASIGYQFNPYFAIMAGGGGELNGNQQFVPVFLHLRANFIPRVCSPFFFAQGGYAFGFQKTPYTAAYNTSLTVSRPGPGGAYLNTGLGLRYMLAQHFGFNIKAGFRLQNIGEGKEQFDNFGYTITNKSAAYMVYGGNVSVGIEF